ncbi:ribonuclease H-like domain-containing protein [Tanacetum coccineum]|uniref:Ribonuclease H-like domain-containing protein n=1 Tax=Tanacetum coccineum TaxID=301880 RepID=A0ABQ4XI67_9ASTR
MEDNLNDVQTPGLKRSSRQSKLPVKLNDYVINSSVKYCIEKYVSYSKLKGSNLCFATTLNKSIEPTCLKDALSDHNWVEAMNNEIEAINSNNTWTECDLPLERKPIGSKWIWKIKYKASSKIKRYKARLVAKGFNQREGFDYDETFSHVVKMVTVRCLISIAMANSWPLYKLDVNNAFLYGDLKEDVYMSLPEGYNRVNNHKVFKLNKSLYGLKQAPRQWNAKLTTALVEHGFEQSKFDYSLYVKKKGSMFVALLVYVDDIVITWNDEVEIKSFKNFLSSKFLIKDLGELKYFLGIEVLKSDKGLCMTQRKYCLELLHEYGLLAAKPVDIPFLENTVLSHVETDKDKFLNNFTSYQKLVWKLIYLTHTRPDINYVVHCLSQHMHSPLQSHFKAALRVLRYLKGSPSLGLQFDKCSDLKLRAYADAD